jgi:hypothetical protein
MILDRLDSRTAHEIFANAGLSRNRRLLGVYAFGRGTNSYHTMLKSSVNHARTNDLLMVHPAKKPGFANDRIGSDRLIEYDMLSSDKFKHLLEAKGIVICRMSQLLGDA